MTARCSRRCSTQAAVSCASAAAGATSDRRSQETTPMQPVRPIARSTCGSQRGITLVEALLSFVVLAFGMLGIARLHADLRAHADLARQHTDATRIAGEEMERLRAFSVLAP